MATETATPAKSSKTGLFIWGLVALLSAGAGGAVPWLFIHQELAEKKPAEKETLRPTVIAFDPVVVNLGDERLTRYLRVKLLLVVDESEAKEANEVLQRQKPFLKSWLIGYLSDQSLLEVSRAIGVNRIRREIRDQFNAFLYPDGTERIHDILFDEFWVQ
jgi:flagellar basal body-associated protein FliL